MIIGRVDGRNDQCIMHTFRRNAAQREKHNQPERTDQKSINKTLSFWIRPILRQVRMITGGRTVASSETG